MNLERRAQLEAAGVDVGQALTRMMGSEALLERLLGKFLEEPNYAALCAALERREPEAAAAAAHGLKGACGNLSMTALYGLFTRQVDALRAGKLAEAERLMEEIAPAYAAVTAAIRGGADGAR